MLLDDKNGKFQCPETFFSFDSYLSDNMSIIPAHGNSNDDGTVTIHSVAVDGPPIDDEEMLNDSFAMPC